MLNTISNWQSEAASVGAEYLSNAADVIDQLYPEASQGEKAISATTLAQTMAISAMTYAISGQAADTPLCAALACYAGQEI